MTYKDFKTMSKKSKNYEKVMGEYSTLREQYTKIQADRDQWKIKAKKLSDEIGKCKS